MSLHCPISVYLSLGVVLSTRFEDLEAAFAGRFGLRLDEFQHCGTTILIQNVRQRISYCKSS